MSYADDVRGALAATSGVARRVQALADLKLPEADVKHIQQNLDEATEALMNVQALLHKNGKSSPSLGVVTSSAGDWRSRVYGGAKEEMVSRRAPQPKRKKTYEEVFGPDDPTVDLAHPWRSGEERTT